MSKYEYTTDAKLVEDMAKAIIQTHIHWSNSDEGRPSEYTHGCEGRYQDAYIEANMGECDEEDFQERYEDIYKTSFFPLLEEAKKLADEKWGAAMLLLGIEAK